MYFRFRKKKLEEVVDQLYSQQPQIDQDVLKDMKTFNATPEEIKKVEKQIEDAGTIYVEKTNMEPVEIFLSCRLEKIIAPTGQMVFEGIRRESIPHVAEMLGFKKVNKETFLRIRILESLAVELLNRRT